MVTPLLVESALHGSHGEDDVMPYDLCLLFHRGQGRVRMPAGHAADGLDIRCRLVLRLWRPPPDNLPEGDAAVSLVVGAEKFKGGTESVGHGGEVAEGLFCFAVCLTEPSHRLAFNDIEGVVVTEPPWCSFVLHHVLNLISLVSIKFR